MYILTRQVPPGLLDVDAAERGRVLGRDHGPAGGHSVATWTATFGAQSGSVRWTLRVDHLSHLQNWVDSARGYGTSAPHPDGDRRRSDVTDIVAEVLMQTGDSTSTRFTAVTTARCAPGCSAEAMAWGSDLTRLVADLIDRPITFVRTVFGPASELAWHVDLADLDDVERFDRLATTDPAWIETTGDGGGYFLPDAFDHQLWRWIR
jgi:hypothetical protein